MDDECPKQICHPPLGKLVVLIAPLDLLATSGSAAHEGLKGSITKKFIAILG